MSVLAFPLSLHIEDLAALLSSLLDEVPLFRCPLFRFPPPPPQYWLPLLESQAPAPHAIEDEPPPPPCWWLLPWPPRWWPEWAEAAAAAAAAAAPWLCQFP